MIVRPPITTGRADEPGSASGAAVRNVGVGPGPSTDAAADADGLSPVAEALGVSVGVPDLGLELCVAFAIERSFGFPSALSVGAAAVGDSCGTAAPWLRSVVGLAFAGARSVVLDFGAVDGETTTAHSDLG